MSLSVPLLATTPSWFMFVLFHGPIADTERRNEFVTTPETLVKEPPKLSEVSGTLTVGLKILKKGLNVT